MDRSNFSAISSLKWKEGAGRVPKGMAYQLPTEAQWEYACRAGTKTAFSFGDSLTFGQANIRGGPGETVDVGKYPANEWGFQDMLETGLGSGARTGTAIIPEASA